MNPTDASHIDWSKALAEHRRWLLTVLLARGVDPGAVQEVFQEVSAAALAAADKLRDAAKLAPWLYRIAVTAALQYRRRRGREKKLLKRYADLGGQSGEQNSDPLNWIMAQEQQQLVRDAIECLPPRDAEMLLLKYTEDWSYRELGEHLGISVSAAEARLHRARAKMRKALASLAPDEYSNRD